jgi:hypothetical protein
LKVPVLSDRLRKWRAEMSPDDRAAFEAIAGDLLADFGYEISSASGREVAEVRP